jgi:hypothetical protein
VLNRRCSARVYTKAASSDSFVVTRATDPVVKDAVCPALSVLVKDGGHLLLDAEGVSEDTSPGDT